MDARERAVERLAAEFHRVDSALGPAWDTITESQRDEWRSLASATLRALGLVAVDPELVEALHIAQADYDAACARSATHVAEGMALIDAKNAIRDAVLAQLEPKA